MNVELAIAELKRGQQVFNALLAGIGEQEYRFRPSGEKWNLLEIVCHLRDEEVEDFRARTLSTLNDPEIPFVPIDPKSWVSERRYAQQEYTEVLEAFLNERQNSIREIEALEEPNWKNVYHHEQLGPLSAKLFLENWVVHDLLHIRQIMNTRIAYIKSIAEHPLDYAGGV